MPSLFLSHNSVDKPFARRLAADLSQLGVTVWIDEAEIRVGDSLIDKVSIAIKDTDYVGAVISNSSVNSPWVKKELHLAMTKEITSRQVVVLPIVICDCDLPAFLIDKLYADFRNDAGYATELTKLFRAIQREETDYEHRVRIGDRIGFIANVSRWCRRIRKSTLRLFASIALFAAGSAFVIVQIITRMQPPRTTGEFGQKMIDAYKRDTLARIRFPTPQIQMSPSNDSTADSAVESENSDSDENLTDPLQRSLRGLPQLDENP